MENYIQFTRLFMIPAFPKGRMAARLLPIMMFIAILLCSFSNSVISQNNILDKYINEAITTNHGLKEQQFLLEKNMLALDEAKSLYKPTVNFGLNYTVAAGGRSISFPIGDIMNPVYSTLNQLTMTSAFPQIENVEEQFLPNNFYDARFRIQQPIINREIYFNKKIKGQLINLKKIEIDVFKRELVKEIKVAYFQYMQATEAIAIYDAALELLLENKRVNKSLLKNDKIIPSVLLRIENEITNVKAQQNDALANEKNAAAYFNFLLNRDLETPIKKNDDLINSIELDGIVFQKKNREELLQLNKAQEINATVVEMESAYKMPNVGLQLDVGSQDFNFKYSGYLLAGLSAEVPIYEGGRNKLQIQQAELDIKATAEKITQVEKQIELQASTARNSMLAAIETWRSYDNQIINAERLYNDTFRRYKEGVSNYIEVLDARVQITNIQLQQSLAFYNALIKQAELERAMAAYTLP